MNTSDFSYFGSCFICAEQIVYNKTENMSVRFFHLNFELAESAAFSDLVISWIHIPQR